MTETTDSRGTGIQNSRHGEVFQLVLEGHTGDLLAKVSVAVPQRLSDKAREAVEVLRAEESDADPRADLYAKARQD